MRFNRAVAVIGAAVVLVGGGAVAVSAATSGSDPVTLCSNNLLKVVSTPNSSGRCPGGSSTIKVASADAVDALQAEVDAQSATNNALQSRLTAAENKIDQLGSRLNELDPGELTATPSASEGYDPTRIYVTFNGHHLEPGARMTVVMGNGVGASLSPIVDANGDLINVSLNRNIEYFVCELLPLTFTVESAWGNRISTTVSSVPGC